MFRMANFFKNMGEGNTKLTVTNALLESGLKISNRVTFRTFCKNMGRRTDKLHNNREYQQLEEWIRKLLAKSRIILILIFITMYLVNDIGFLLSVCFLHQFTLSH